MSAAPSQSLAVDLAPLLRVGSLAPEVRDVKTQRGARNIRTCIEAQIAQAEFIGWPELAESFRSDLQRVESLMAQRGWL